MAKPLTVYKASAGSGKTFTLATEYIKLLVNNPHSFRNILAVTFTNKATEEMKMRIVSQLYGIGMNYDDSKSYVNILCQKLDCSEEFLRQRAKAALHLLLHNYSFFRVETIDSFFQSVLRNLARELDLTANLRIELNDRQVEELAVDGMIDDLKATDDIMEWIMDYIYDNMQEDKSWNVIGQIKSFGQTIFKDFYKDHRQQLSVAMQQPAFFNNFSARLKKQRDMAQDKVKTIAATFFDAIDNENLSVEDFSFGTGGVAGFFLKIKDGPIPPGEIGKRALACVDAPEKWCTKSHQRRSEIMALADNTLNNVLKYAIETMPEQWNQYQSAQLAMRHLYQLRLLDAIENKVRSLNDEAGRFLLCDTQHLLHSLINDNDSPFIFEKIGSYLENIMIDEFQDTSIVQWKNFKVLLNECMSRSGSENMIVGDVKQSIYRWRAGDWRLLNNIDEEFVNSQELLDIKTLATNYRSLSNVVNFNNVFFEKAQELEYLEQTSNGSEEALQLVKAYNDVKQKTKSDEQLGLVSVKLLPATDYQERVMQTMVEQVEQLVERGVSASNIAILVRTNSLIPVVANYFADHSQDVNIVSDEAYRLDSSVAVNILVEALRLLTHPDDRLTRFTLAYMYQKNALGKQCGMNEVFMQCREVDELLPARYIDEKEKLLLMPLYDLVEQLCKMFDIDKLEGQTAYICAFLDEIINFATNASSDIDAFLVEWQASIGQKTIRGDKVNGVRILSIHKSKGLEYDNVIIPFCDWQLEKSHGNMIWCSPESEPYDMMPLLPIDYSRKSLLGTVFQQDYLHENLQNTVDNLNLLYVAFTRASHNLFVIGKRNASNSRSALIEQCLPIVAQKMKGSRIEGVEDLKAEVSFEYGSLYIPVSDGKKESENVMLKKAEPLAVSYKHMESEVAFKQSNKSRDFIEGDDDSTTYIKLGCLLHNVLSRIATADDIDAVVAEMDMEGLIDSTITTKAKITDMLHKRLSSRRVSHWFSGQWQLYNECTLLRYDHNSGTLQEKRPDRVMTNGEETVVVDFKFGTPHDEHRDQVAEYISLLREMGMTNVKGYLWYVYKNIIEEVEA